MAWAHSATLTCDHTQAGSADSSNFPVLVYKTDAKFKSVANGGAVQSSVSFNGQTVPADLCFYSDSGLTTLLSWDFAYWDAVNGIIAVKVKVGTLSVSSDTVFYVAVGDSAVTTYQGGSVGAAYDSNFVWLFNFAESSGGSGAIKDATSNANNMTDHNSPTFGVTGPFGKALQFDGTNDYADSATSASMDAIQTANKVTLTLWIKNLNTSQTNCYAADRLTNVYAIIYGYVANTYEIYGHSGSMRHTIKGSVSDTNWHKIDIAWDGAGDRLDMYYDGTSTYGASETSGNIVTSSNGLMLGAALSSAGWMNAAFGGWWASKSIRSTSWLTAEWNNQKASSTFLTLGSWTGGGSVVRLRGIQSGGLLVPSMSGIRTGGQL